MGWHIGHFCHFTDLKIELIWYCCFHYASLISTTRDQRKLLAIDLLPELFAGPETYGLALLYGNRFTGSGISTLPRRFVSYGKGAEMNEFYGLTGHHRTLQIVEKTVDDKGTIALGESKLIG
jgi:hypothetical protein